MGILRGIGIVVFIVALAGVIAYIGDRVGHQVGRKRLTLFNIRPRYTSTIVAVATGMIIALIVTLAAIFASNQVQTAFFHLNEINNEIAKAQARAAELEQKVNNSPVVVNLDQLLVPSVGRVPQNYPPALRRQIVNQFYNQAVSYVNRTYTAARYGLKKFSPPADIDKTLETAANGPTMQAMNSQSDVLLLAVADQNLYPGDQIHFSLNAEQDRLLVRGGEPIASLTIPTGKNANADLALAELLGTYVPHEMLQRNMLPYFATNVLPEKMLPELASMRTMLGNGGNYILTAFAAADIYQHTFSVPVVVTLQKAP
ncbi:MAG TPA: DUF3084 domain-containing protein [Candidatus Baltobacteraceae bacterium]|nr:DUF3084 domain-containing protein [Candidatus Baltobacteraceae bacterium]